MLSAPPGEPLQQQKEAPMSARWRVYPAMLCLLACLAIGSECPADTAWWVCDDPTGDWSVADNWLVNDMDDPRTWWPAVPTSSDDAIIDNGGTVRIAAGTASADALAVGFTRSGTLVQTGGRLEAEGVYIASGLAVSGGGGIPPLPPGWIQGRYEVHGGELDVSDKGVVGVIGAGVIVQTAGRCTYDELMVMGTRRSGSGRYELWGAAELTATTFLAVIGDNGEFAQMGGSVRSASVVASDGGTCTLSGGSIDTESLAVGKGGTAPGQGPATLAITSEAVQVEVSEEFQLAPVGQFQAVPGTVIQMAGADFVNSGTVASDVADLANTTLVFEGAAGGPMEFEAAGADWGATTGGFRDNFAHGAIRIGDAGPAVVKLFDRDDSDGFPALAEAVYVMNLRIGPGSELDLSGLNVYCLASRIDPTATVTGPGTLTRVGVPDGDADLSGKVNIFDLAILASHYGGANRNWMQADFNCDGLVNVLDLAMMANNYGLTIGPRVPEPSILLLLTAAAAIGLRRRRKRRN